MNRAKDNQTFKESLQHKKGPHRKITGRWRRGKPGVLQFMGSQGQTRLSDSTTFRVSRRLAEVTEQN